MFLLNRVRLRGVLRIKNNNVCSKSTKLRNYDWSTLSCDFHAMAYEKSRVNYCYRELISCKYSSTINQITELAASGTDVGEDRPQIVETIFAEIAKGDPQVLRQLKLLNFEIEVLRETDKCVPRVIKKREWEEILSLTSMSGRKKYLMFLFKNEKKAENRKLRKEQQKQEYLKMLAEKPEPNPLEYNLNNQSLFFRIYNKSLLASLNLRNELNYDIAQHIVFDCCYQEYMNSLNSRFCAIQLLYCLNLSLYHKYPSFIRLCNLKKNDELYKVLPKYILNVFNDNFPWPIQEESYLDIYPKQKLVYLTPHCIEPLKELHPEDIYVIGAFVDKGIGVKASLARAKEHNLRMARLPLDEYISWKQGTKSLPLNIVLKILLDMKFSRNWYSALKNIPRRHYDGFDFDDLKVPGDLFV